MMESSGGSDDEDRAVFKKLAEQLLPMANVGRIMKKALPPNAKVSKEAKETMQECVSEFISFVTSEASDKCKRDRRQSMTGDDVCSAMSALGFDYFSDTVWRYLERYRLLEEEKASQDRNNADGIDQDRHRDRPSDTDHDRNRAESSTTASFDRKTDKLF